MDNRKNFVLPSLRDAAYYLKQWTGNYLYCQKDLALSELFCHCYTQNNKFSEVLIKVCALNSLYSTAILDTSALALHIVEQNIDRWLNKGDIFHLNDMALVELQQKKRHFYSFATKYCSFHRPDNYAIYDYFIVKLLTACKKYDPAWPRPDMTQEKLRDYPFFHGIMQNFRVHYGLTQLSLKEMDQYLWLKSKKELVPSSFPLKKL